MRLGRHVAVSIPRKDQQAATARVGHDDLAVFLVHSECVRADQLRLGTLE